MNSPSDGGHVPPIQFARARGGRLAFQAWGSGPAVVAIPPLAQNIEMAWERPEIRAMLHRLGSFASMVHFDKRGTGVSDRSSEVPGIDERVDDVRAVMDAAGVEHAYLFAQSEGGPMAILFAVTYPDRVDGLILNGSGPATYPPDMTDDYVAERRTSSRRMAELWGTPESPVVDGFAPSLAADQDFRSWHQRYERAAASSDTLVELLDLSLDMDVREVLPDVDVPTLVLHRTGDRIVSVERGREVADAVPGAVMITQDGDDHFAYAGDLDWILDMERFVTGTVSEPKQPSPTPVGTRIVTLGRFAVVAGGEEVPTAAWGSRLARQLCKRLVAARGWPVTRDELIDMLWPDDSDMRRLGARLSVQLSAVRRVLGGGVIADRQSVRLDLDAVSTDLEDFYSADDDGAIVAAYAGDFLPEDVYEDWSGGARDEARLRFVTAAKRVIERSMQSNSYTYAASLARRLLAVDEYSDDAHRALISALNGAGETRQAGLAYGHWKQTAAELGVAIPAFADIS